MLDYLRWAVRPVVCNDLKTDSTVSFQTWTIDAESVLTAALNKERSSRETVLRHACAVLHTCFPSFFKE